MFEGMTVFHWWVIGAQVAGLAGAAAIAVLTAVRMSKNNAREIAVLNKRVGEHDVQIAEMPKAEIYGRLNTIDSNLAELNGKVGHMDQTLVLMQRSLLKD